MPVSSSAARMAARNAGNDHVKDGDDARDDGLEDCADAVDDGHQAATDCAQDGLDLFQYTYEALQREGDIFYKILAADVTSLILQSQSRNDVERATLGRMLCPSLGLASHLTSETQGLGLFGPQALAIDIMTRTCTPLLPANDVSLSLFPRLSLLHARQVAPSSSFKLLTSKHVLSPPINIRKYVDTTDMTTLSSTLPPNTEPQRQASQNPESAYNDDLTAPKRRKRRPGRPLLSFAQLRARKAAREADRRSKSRWKFASQQANPSASLPEEAQSKRRNGSSALEQLPVELLERIFLYALETNFCRASPFLASAVSSERIYRTLIRLAFFKDGSFPQVSVELRHQIKTAHDAIADALKPADYETMRLDETDRVNLQVTILRCRWCTKKRILTQFPALLQMIVWKHWVGAGIVLDPRQQPDLDYILRGSGEDYIRNFPYRDPLEGIGPDGVTYHALTVPLNRVVIYGQRPGIVGIKDTHQVMNIRVIPDYLLRGRRKVDGDGYQFTDEDIDLLEIFRDVYGDDGNGHDVQFSRDALHSGIRTAISTWHERALTSLLRLDEYMLRLRLENAPPPGYPNLSTGIFYAIPQQHFLQAIQLPMPDAMYCFLLLLRCNAESMPPDSSELTQWAMDLSSYRCPPEGNTSDSDVNLARKLGKWLLDFMIELPGSIEESRENPQEKAIFYKGSLNRHTQLGRRFLEEVCPYISRDFQSWENEDKHWVRLVSYNMRKQWFIDVQQ
ncbi:uncharacterized protein BHQ10_001085 [Talaromyces amestolkiae]|uniref:Uncharacterized protein n=1 Tax=Talaromyces amestolkiae TaxID=1196081 RepID=A0A364KNE0_TALAM|nr:uncharacterized protein BHQ10_001085 [Talaromyces amestolkiae]RAO65073.1 hypothetical protein BHQ10_001085 [Talaromyces amestolkiae]